MRAGFSESVAAPHSYDSLRPIDGQTRQYGHPCAVQEISHSERLCGSPAAELENIIKSTGFFRNKSKSIRGAMREIIEKHGGKVPATMEELCALPVLGARRRMWC